jgi:NitT/TauT family transport system ATP-binding protein
VNPSAAGSPTPSAAPRPDKLVVERVSKTFRGKTGDVLALAEIDLRVAEGEFVCLLGPSGCGKSTLLNLIAGLERPDSGRVLVDGRPVTGPGRERMVLFQEAALFPWLDALDNVLFGLKLKQGLDAAERRAIALQHLERVGLARFTQSAVHELSGGMKQRVALARALAPDPVMLLMDEPFGALDAMTREQMYADLQQIWAESRKTIVFVTHNMREAVVLGDRVLLFSPHPGRIREELTIDLPRPRDINDYQVAQLAARIRKALRAHAEGAGEGAP